MSLSINARLILAAGVIMVLFFGIIGWTLDSIYRNDREAALKDRLESDAYALIAAAELGDDGILRLSYLLPDIRFLTVNSGVFAQITANDSGQEWHSASMSRLDIPFVQRLLRAERRFEQLLTSDGRPVYAFSIGVAWQGSSKKGGLFTVSVAETLRDYEDKIRRFRRNLWIWLGGAAVLLLALQSIILRWGLRPLTRVAEELHAIERGEARTLSGHYPNELRALTQNLNTLIQNRHDSLERYRNSLDDLAHSLKTPLAVLRGLGEEQHWTTATRITLKEQVDHMVQIVSYQLQKAAASGGGALTAPVPIQAVAEKIISTLNKVYADKRVHCRLLLETHNSVNAGDVSPGMDHAGRHPQSKAKDGAIAEISFRGDSGDLMELLGNLLDNAYKWCRSEVELRVTRTTLEEITTLHLSVEDDGPGIPEKSIQQVLERGVRADPMTSGHGIGLAVVNDIVQLYEGTTTMGRSSLGGAAIQITLPGV